MKLKYKFFITFIITSFLILLLVIGVTQVTIRKNFIHFVNNTEFDKLTKMKGLLKQNYQRNNGWDDFHGNQTAWRDLLFQSRPDNLDPDFIHPPRFDHTQNKNVTNLLNPLPGRPLRNIQTPWIAIHFTAACASLMRL